MREYFPVIKKSALFQGISEDDLDGMLICLGALLPIQRTSQFSGKGNRQILLVLY